MKKLILLLLPGLIATTMACKIKPIGTIEAGTPFLIKVGEAYAYPQEKKALFILQKIVEDSRCPTGQNCLRAGAIKAKVLLKDKHHTDTLLVTLEEGKSTPVSFPGQTLAFQLKKATPYPVDGQRISEEDYQLTFVPSLGKGKAK